MSFFCRHVPTAVLSRQTAGLRGKSLIMNLPGKPKAIRETIDEVSFLLYLNQGKLNCQQARRPDMRMYLLHLQEAATSSPTVMLH